MKEQFYKFFLALLTLCFVGTAGVAYADGFEASTAESPKWYTITSGRDDHNVLTSNGIGARMTGETSPSNTRRNLWRFEARTDNSSTYNIVNYAGEYIDPANLSASIGNASADVAFIPVSTVPSSGWTITATATGASTYTIACGTTQLHQGASSTSYYVIKYGGGSNTSDVGGLFSFTEATDVTAAYSISSVSVSSGSQTFGVGNTDQLLLASSVTTSGFTGSVSVNSVTINFGSDTNAAASDLKNVKVYTSRTVSNNFYSNRSSLTLQGTSTSVNASGTTITFDTPLSLEDGTTYFYVAADVADNATVGNYIDAELSSITYNTDQTYSVSSGNPTGKACIYTTESLPYKPGDEGAVWRIPAMVVLRHQKTEANNGRIVAIADNRFNHGGDLPNHCDLYETHSDDNGKTWSTKQNVAGTDADHAFITANSKGYGDAAIVETANGKLICVMAAGVGFNNSNATNHGEVFYITSDDAGATWTDPKSLTDLVFNHKYAEGDLAGTFAASGRGLLLEHQTEESGLNGRVLFALCNRITGQSDYKGYILYSDDEGTTWKINNDCAFDGTDESKLVERRDGAVMISVRRYYDRGFNTSYDGGMTWKKQFTTSTLPGNRCNADVLKYGDYALVHTYVNNVNRSQLEVCLSYDNGHTWTDSRMINEPGAAYSTLDYTYKDKNIALFYEDNSCSSSFNLNFITFPISLLGDESGFAKKAYDATLALANTKKSESGYDSYLNTTTQTPSAASITALNETITKYASVTDADKYAEAIKALDEALANVDKSFVNDTIFLAQSIAKTTGYTSISSATSGQYSQETVTAISEQLAKTDLTEAAMVEALKPLIAAAEASIADETIIKANIIAATTGWTDYKSISIGQYSQTSIDAIKAVLAKTELDEATLISTLQPLVEKAESTLGTFTISSYSGCAANTVDGTTKPMYITTSAGTATSASETCYFTFVPTSTTGQYYIKAKDADTYLYRSGNTLATTSDKKAWTPTSNSDGYYYLVATHHANNSYLVIDVTSSSTGLNWWSSNSGSTQWSTKFSITQVVFEPADISSAITAAEAALAKTGVGYPTADAAARTTLSEAIATAKAIEIPTDADVTTLTTATTAYKASTSDIQMPEDGKAYTITFKTWNDTKGYITYDESGYKITTTSDADNSNYPMTAKLICHKVSATEYVFLNNYGKYLIWRGKDNGYNSSKGYSDTYESDYSFNITQMTTGSQVTSGVTQDKFFGCVKALSNKQRSSSNSNKSYYIAKTDLSAFDQANNAYYFTSGFTSALLIEETDYPNTPTFIAAEGISGVDSIATFSAPFATIVPENSAAYYVTQETNADGTTIAATTMIAEGEAIPANEGVILLKDAGDTQPVTMVPVADETKATITGNLLGNSAGAEKTIAESDCAYVLAKANSLVAFYHAKVGTTLKINRAYLKHSNGASSIALRFGGETTNISSILTDTTDGAPVYDLSGRRIAQPTKGGVYIRGGKKYIK